MFQHTILFVLVAYPVLCLLPLNLIRFRWGFMNGSAPMPPEIEAKAEFADRTAIFVIHLMLFVLVALSMRGSSISFREVGFSLGNWKPALGMGLMFSLFFVGLGELILSRVPTEAARKEPESRGPVATWCGLILSGSLSSGIWRAFCIVALMRHGIPAWLAIVLTTLFSAVVSLQFNVYRALGAVAAGGVTGFLFVDTGSLLAPVSVSIIAGISDLYYVRHSRSGARPPSSRFSMACPVCGQVIHLTEVRWAGDMITCPYCCECLTTRKKYLWVAAAVSVAMAGYAMWQFISRDIGYFLVAEVLALLFFFVLAFNFSFVVPPKLKKVQGRPFNKAMSLFGTDQSADKNNKPRK